MLAQGGTAVGTGLNSVAGFDSRIASEIATETGAAIGGTLYSDALSGPEGPAATYLAMMRQNLSQMTAALSN